MELLTNVSKNHKVQGLMDWHWIKRWQLSPICLKSPTWMPWACLVNFALHIFCSTSFWLVSLWFVIDGFDQHIKAFCTPTSRIEYQTWGCWMRSVNATSVLCPPSPPHCITFTKKDISKLERLKEQNCLLLLNALFQTTSCPTLIQSYDLVTQSYGGTILALCWLIGIEQI